MSLIARKILNNLRVQQNIRFRTLANKVGLISSCENCAVNNSQYELLNLNTPKNHFNRFTIGKTYVTSPVRYSFKDTVSGFLSKFNVKKQRNDILFGFYFFVTIDQINYEEFVKLLKMPDTFYTWFKITELHVCMISMRLMNEKGDMKRKRDGVINAMWEDAEKRVKEMEPSSKMRKAHFTELYQRFMASCYIYDQGFLSNDMELANSLWHQFFGKKCEDPRILEALISYCRYQIAHLFSVDVNKNELPKETPIWLPLKPHFKYL